MQVAVIGGGVGGLAVAYNLVKDWRGTGSPPTVTVYEASNRFGGNGDTVFFNLDPNTVEMAVPYVRWADLGVNDFNKPAYTQIVDVMNEIGYTGYARLEDSTCYYTLDGSIIYATGNSPYGTNPMPQELSNAVDAFMTQAATDYNNGEYFDYTMRDYVEKIFSQNPAYDLRLGPQVIFPRINGMYFTDEVDPSGLPFAAVMHYYQIQEGVGGQAPQRMYFVDGCSNWIDALTGYMSANLGVSLVDNFQASLAWVDGAWNLTNVAPGAAPADPIVPDVVVVATHADDALKLITSGVSTEMMNCLGKIKYLNGLSVAHTYTGTLPPDYNGWCTYNILIHQEATYLKPYTITYVCNRHQNDGANPAYDKFGWPQFFITVNPPVPIPEEHVLIDQTTGKPAVANLRHNVFDFNCLAAQSALGPMQGTNGLYFAGGWTLGAGLHEECWIQGQTVAALIGGAAKTNDNHYDKSRPPGEYAPKYMRRLSKR